MNISIKREQNNARISSAEREKFGAKLNSKILSPLRRDGYKAGMIMMLIALSTMLLTTACSSEDDLVNNTANTENTINKGYALPVTVNVTRGDGATRASYNESTRKLEFSAGDKLFVKGNDYSAGGAGFFAGTLTWQSGGTFSGTILTENAYSGTIDALFTAGSALATLLPANYGNYPYLYFTDEGTYSASITYDATKTFATSKATAVEQFSFEVGGYTSGTGFALHPANAILNFTITGLAASTNVTATLTNGSSLTISGEVNTNASGTATFAIGVYGYTDLNEFSLTVGGNPISLVSSSKELTAGKIYNITRGTGALINLASVSDNTVAQNGVTLTGTLGANVQISIADGATVILNNVTINGTNNNSYPWAGITCLGNATIILSGTNTVKGFYENYPGIQAAAGNTLTINGTGSLTASSNGYGCGIGGGYNIACGHIEIQGGTVTATGGNQEAGIGGGNNANCGNITISGGTVTATGGSNGGAGIGSGPGYQAGCGDITITTGVTKVTATKGSGAPNSIGAGFNGSCGTVTIDGVANATTSSTFTNFNSSVSGNTWTLTHK